MAHRVRQWRRGGGRRDAGRGGLASGPLLKHFDGVEGLNGAKAARPGPAAARTMKIGDAASMRTE